MRHLLAALAAVCLTTTPPLAQAAAEKPAKPVPRGTRPAARKPPVVALPQATPEQMAAADRVFYGHYQCELRQAIDIASDPKHPGYVAVRHGKAAYVMKPVLSSTGAIRLEDVKGATLMVQIAAKSMLLDVKAGRRLVDDCVSPQQREAIEAAARAQAAEAAASAASAAGAAGAASEPSAASAAAAGAVRAPAEPASAPASDPGR